MAFRSRDVEPAETPSGPLSRQERRSGTEKEIKYEIATPRDILDRVGNEPRRLDRRMQSQILSPAAPHGVHRSVIPNISPVATMLTEFNHVEVRDCPHAIDKDELMLGPVKRSHPRIGLVPDA